MDLLSITSEFQFGLLMINLDKPKRITISTYDIDLTLFILEFYDPDIEYHIYYWLKIKDLVLPKNVHLHQLNNNHCKFWYIETNSFNRLIITSCNLTHSMVHDCYQSFCSFTCPVYGRINNDHVYQKTYKQFFDIFNINLDYNLFKQLENKLVFNIPNRVNGIERWFMSQKSIIIDSNNVSFNYLPKLEKTIVVRDEVPPSYSSIICYYSLEKNSNLNKIFHCKFEKLFHYKLYYTDKYVLLSSNNFSFNHKNNYELGIVLNGRNSKL